MRLRDAIEDMIGMGAHDFGHADPLLTRMMEGGSEETFSYGFCAENAYLNIAKQVSFGPRVPGSPASKQCARWIVEELSKNGAVNISEQTCRLTAYNGDVLDAVNISAQIKPESMDRVLLVSHWDSRPWADCDPDPANWNKAIDGANDGASGVGVILELLRVLAQFPPVCGIDVLFVDAEDYGQRKEDMVDEYDEYSWCLGTQYWLDNPTVDVSRINFGILLDMVGGKDAVFPREYISQHAAGSMNDLVWLSAQRAGFSDRFPDRVGGAVIDDHVFFLLNHIPTIEIIESGHPGTGFLNPTWHTMGDSIKSIDTASLKAVGMTLERLLRLKGRPSFCSPENTCS